MQDKLLNLFSELQIAQNGHFKMESGLHSNLWLDLDKLFLQPDRLLPFTKELGNRFATHEIDVICGPQIGGAQVAQMIASHLHKTYCYSDRVMQTDSDKVAYKIPAAFRDILVGKRIAVVDDVIQAGSAIRKTITDLEACGTVVVAIGGLLTLGTPAQEYAKEKNIALENIANRENKLWKPGECPMCISHIPLDNVT